MMKLCGVTRLVEISSSVQVWAVKMPSEFHTMSQDLFTVNVGTGSGKEGHI